MNPMSKLRPVSFGIAAENLAFNSRILEVTAVEWLPYLDGEINTNPTDIEDKGVDGTGQDYEAKVASTNTLPAEWLPWGSNRLTPPNIRRGERLMIYQFADSDKYYWKELGLDDGLRRLETVVYVFSNTRDETVKALTPDNAYSIEVSTHTKQITLRTNKNDGEPFAYTFQFNTKDGVVTLMDDDENYMEFDSAERRITAKNKDTSFITIDKREIRMFAPDLIHAKTERVEVWCNTMLIEANTSIEANVGVSTTLNSGSTIDITTTDYTLNASNSIGIMTTNYTLNASAAIDMTTAAWTVNAATLQGNIAASTFTGTVTILGLATLAGGIAAIPGGAGTATFSIPINATAPITATGAEITANGIGLSTHKHVESGDGAPVSPPIP